MNIKNALQKITGLLLPAVCPVCKKAPAPYPLSLCERCRSSVLSGRHMPLVSTKYVRYVASCRGYEGTIAECLRQFKYYAGYSLRHVFDELVGNTLDEAVIPPGRIDLVVPVPLHRMKLRQRGFNQSALIAKCVSSRAFIPLSENSLIKQRCTPPQMCLSREKRTENLKDAFSVRTPQKFGNKTVLLIDDVMTTGTTLNEAAKELLRAGAKEVLALTLARTL